MKNFNGQKIFIGLLLLFLLLSVGIQNCSNNSSVKNKTEIVQACLNKMHQNKAYDYLEQSNLILVDNEQSSALGELHLGKKQLVLTKVDPSEIKIYASAKDVVDNKRHVTIFRIIVNNTTATVI